ncbi:MAG: hypothetical protein ACLQPH_09470 [Acidimicrobiales bacterium]
MPDDLEKWWRKYLQAQRQAIGDAFARVFDAHHDRPVPEVMVALRYELDALGVSMTDEELRSYSEVIASGHPVGWRVE